MPDLRVLGGRYQLVDRVGRGRMGTVWRARDRLLGHDVGVKEILLPRGLDDEDLAAVCDRALREARAAAQIRHPAVVRIHDVVMEDNHPWIVMDLVRARSLADRIEDGGALPVAEVTRIGEALAGALRVIHDEGIVHRDLKPANVLIDADGHVVLTGFGIATIEGDACLTASGLLIGTPGFMAPERLSGEASGPPSDLWALGAVLYTAVEGRSPYEGSTPMVIASAVLTKEPPRPQRAGPLAPLLADLLARNPVDRPNARQVADRLAALARTPETRTDRANPPTRREPLPGGPGFPGGRGPAGRPPPPPGGPNPGHPVGAPPPDRAGRPDAVRAVKRRWWRRIPTFWMVTMIVIVVVAIGAGVVRYVISRPAVDPCALLTADQANGLVHGAHRRFERAKAPTVTDDCSWDQTDLSGLTVGVATYSTAREATAALHNEEYTYRLDSTLGISGIGDEVRGFYTGMTKSVEVLFRRDRYYAIVSYGGVDSVEPRTTEQSKALQAARWVDARLAALDR